MTLATTLVGFGIIIAAGTFGWNRYWKNREVDPIVEAQYRPLRRALVAVVLLLVLGGMLAQVIR